MVIFRQKTLVATHLRYLMDNQLSSDSLELRWMDPYELAENPRNPRHH